MPYKIINETAGQIVVKFWDQGVYNFSTYSVNNLISIVIPVSLNILNITWYTGNISSNISVTRNGEVLGVFNRSGQCNYANLGSVNRANSTSDTVVNITGSAGCYLVFRKASGVFYSNNSIDLIKSLYAGGKKGMWYQPLDANTRFQDQAGTIYATIANPATGILLDKSGNGLSLRQATSTARPLFNARVNLLTKTDDFSDAAWSKRGTASVGGPAPDGTGQLLTVAAFTNDILQTTSGQINDARYEPSVSIWPVTVIGILSIQNPQGVDAGSWTVNMVSLTPGTWNRITRVHPSVSVVTEFSGKSGGAGLYLASNDAVEKKFYAKQTQLELGTSFTKYQRVNTETDYDIAGFPQSLKYNGIDAGISTAAFTAGTLGSNMDVFMAVQRAPTTSATGTILMWDRISSGPYLFAIDGVDGTSACSNASGTPTYAVNGVLVPGGSGVTHNQLGSAVPPNQLVILEARNVDMSLWLSCKLGVYSTNYPLQSSIGSIVMCPAQSDESRTQIRQALAAEVGAVLP